eukprot:TRINITY_DN1876_c0_g2_i3.p1 TRINITY_DN1876_c0_g2~~TRINITY_DN1876_c0_g2_i3.p1  ORF type:complete len:146 (+),score=18.33 TRINITY_DN1876_c0_g2_i3:131-568(+)
MISRTRTMILDAIAPNHFYLRISKHLRRTSSYLNQKSCVPCEGKAKPLDKEATNLYLKQLEPSWRLRENQTLFRQVKVQKFMEGLELFEKIGSMAEQEGHHPDLHLTGYSNVTIEYYTHAIGGLSENDFICAAKVDQIIKQSNLK